jgi:hypothetical protein
MAHIGDVITYLRPNGGWVCRGSEYEDIEFTGDEPGFTKEEFLAGFAKYDAFIAEQNAQAEAAKAAAKAKLAALGLTADDLKALGLGSD